MDTPADPVPVQSAVLVPDSLVLDRAPPADLLLILLIIGQGEEEGTRESTGGLDVAAADRQSTWLQHLSCDGNRVEGVWRNQAG
jgi:hypothetical protein